MPTKRESWLAANTLTPEKIAIARRVVNEVHRGRDLGDSLRAHALKPGGVLGKSFLVAAYNEMIADGTLDSEYIVADSEHSQFEIVKHASTVGARAFAGSSGTGWISELISSVNFITTMSSFILLMEKVCRT